VNWDDIDRAFPERELPPADAHDWKATRERVEAIATHLARAVAGLPTHPIDRDLVRTTVYDGHRNAFMVFGFGAGGTKERAQAWKGVLGLIAAIHADWELAAKATGGKPIASRVVATRTFGDAPAKLARHLGAAVRGKLPAAEVEAAMTDLRTRFVDDTLPLDGRVALVAAHLYFHQIAVSPDVPAACRAWLEGGALDVPDSAPRAPAVADGEDPRVKIFERYAAELSDDTALAELADELRRSADREEFRAPEDAARFTLATNAAMATHLFVARKPLPEGWERRADPLVVLWLGGTASPRVVADHREVLAGYVERFHDKAESRLAASWNHTFPEAVFALLAGDPVALVHLTGGGRLPRFRPGQFYKDDPQKLLRYLAAAIDAKAEPAAVIPAWHDFLSRRSPETNPSLKGGRLGWYHLIAIQSAITEQLGGEPPAQVGRELQRAVTGV